MTLGPSGNPTVAAPIVRELPKRCLSPYRVPTASIGLISSHLRAATKREALAVVMEPTEVLTTSSPFAFACGYHAQFSLFRFDVFVGRRADARGARRDDGMSVFG